MLYIWPYFLFFSWPLLYQRVIATSIKIFHSMSQRRRPRNSSSSQFSYRALLATMTMAIMALIVRYNTIIHPFTLADNRHYMFYAFRILLRHPLVKYAVVPIYYFGAVLCIAALGQPMPIENSSIIQPLSSSSSKSFDAGNKRSAENRGNLSSSSNGTAFTLVYLLATTLSLVTAPLVEPRYFILPWLIWRLHLPSKSALHEKRSHTEVKKRGKRRSGGDEAIINPNHYSSNQVIKWLLQDPLAPLWIETLWFSIVNLGTCYVFLRWGFEWKQEEPGKVQRFMW